LRTLQKISFIRILTIFRSGLTVAAFTLVSRIFGLIRELFIANLFGAGSTADAVNVAFKLPNLFRRIFGEGALSTVFIPIFNEKLIESDLSARKFTGKIFVLLTATLIALCIVMQLFMPSLMFLIAPGFYEDKDKFDLTVLLCRITVPYLIFISISALFGGILNSVRRFAAFAFSPVILSLVVVIGTQALQDKYGGAVSISISVILAGIVQVLFMYYCVRQANLTFPLIFQYKDKDVNRFLRNMGPATLSAGAGQLGLFVSQSIASFIPGAVSILSYADRIYQFPLSIIGITFGTILLPELSKIYKLNDLSAANFVQNKAIKVALLLSLPAAAGIIILSHPIIHIIFERGQFGAADTIKTAEAISAFAFGLPAFVLAKIITPIFYANGDTKTPLKITVLTLMANIIFNIILLKPFAHVGIALGTSIASWFNVWLLYRYAVKAGKLQLDESLKDYTLKILLSSGLMSLIIFTAKVYGNSYFYSSSTFVKVSYLSASIAAGGGTILVVVVALGLHKILLAK